MALSDRQKKALKGYGNWRPRLGRGATWAGAGALLTRAATNNKKIMLPVAAGAGLAGIGDKMLEEKSEKNRQIKKLVGEGFEKDGGISSPCREDGPPVLDREPWASFSSGAEESAVNSRQGMLQGLFSNKALLKARAKGQLKSLFPNARDESMSNAITAAGPASEASRLVRRAFKR